MKTALLFLIASLSAFGQLLPFPGPAFSTASAPNPTLVSSCVGSAHSGSSAAAVSSVDCTGVTKIIFFSTCWAGGTPSASDSSSNSYTSIGSAVTGWWTAVEKGQMFYVSSPTVTSSMTFTNGCSGMTNAISFVGYTNTDVLDDHNEFNTPGTQTGFVSGTVTASQSNDLACVGWGHNGGTSDAHVNTVTTGYTIHTSIDSGSSLLGAGMACKVVSSGSLTGTINFASWGGNDRVGAIALFKHS